MVFLDWNFGSTCNCGTLTLGSTGGSTPAWSASSK